MAKKLYDENGNEVKRGGCLKWIGIGIIALIALFIIGSLFSGDKKSVNTESSKSQTSESQSSSKKENKKLAVGDAAEIDGIKFKVNNVEFTDERNQFAESNPERVIKISYTLENGQDKDYAFGADTQLYVDGKKAKTYPLSGSDGDIGFGSVSAGRTVDSTVYYGVDGKDIELEWQPLFSVGEKAIWKLSK
ncbi:MULTISPECIES: DUF4352 domain-containing protein [Aerococcus]|uniref:DUF4352 domain-containing protein n=2 Tax=Aerococcus TaxID=1375 RepID=A0A178HDW1_9LACT|nr:MULTISPECIES: DUF4352 domain-containing protein [Aerococcus]KAA9218671.1 DUF4352 domain-containing protein [Aerococcus loyolae]KAA9265026.1 DUF4352 domain-containing protein [Aerococcus loyolae]MCY3025873.1 DUF4352 domain-containing protein [Aerococcus loyolae]MCY3027724.1 DUF4352 domain-containing protein [Aerococcus loyolae]MCY3029629.1 DUF4352 domain-containing protein [Aerococcus loyolae]